MRPRSLLGNASATRLKDWWHRWISLYWDSLPYFDGGVVVIGLAADQQTTSDPGRHSGEDPCRGSVRDDKAATVDAPSDHSAQNAHSEKPHDRADYFPFPTRALDTYSRKRRARQQR